MLEYIHMVSSPHSQFSFPRLVSTLSFYVFVKKDYDLMRYNIYTLRPNT